MQIYEMRRQNLPAEVLVYKEIGRRILSSKQFKRMRTLKLVINKRKSAYRGIYHGSSWQFGGRAIQMGTGITRWKTENGYKEYRVYVSLLEEDMIKTYIHELAHMVQFNSRSIRINGRVHNRTFSKLVERLKKNYELNVKPELENIRKECKKIAEGFKDTQARRLEEHREQKIRKTSIEGKLEKTTAQLKRWTTKFRRAETAIKKLNRRKKLYERLLAKSQ